MAKVVKLYWDSCAWIGLLNGEADKKRELEIVYGSAKKGIYQIWTSTLAMVETNRVDSEVGKPKPYDSENEKIIHDLFHQPCVMPIALDGEIAGLARKIWRETPGLGKFKDSIHVASALKWNIETMHTYDRDDLLHLSGRLSCKNGLPLTICYPDETTDGPLFGRPK